jgi:hypothetical protein
MPLDMPLDRPVDRRRHALPMDDTDLAPDVIMQGSPFAIPAKPPGSKVELAVEQGDFGAFLTALGVVFGLVALVGLVMLR